jgi:site-specific DNA-methyltransferase (adenine-specific)
MPESVKDRCTKSHEYIFLLSKSLKYSFDWEAIQEPCSDQERTNYACGGGKISANTDRNDNDLYIRSKEFQPAEIDGVKVRNKRDVWTVTPSHYKEAHFATFPEELVKPMVLAGCPSGGIVLDPFMGSGTTAVVAKLNDRKYIGVELNPDYIKMAKTRLEYAVKPYALF